MKRIALALLLAMTLPQGAVLAHPENHVHSQWIKERFVQLYRKIDELNARIGRLEHGGSAPSTGMARLDVVCPPGEGKLCTRSCQPGWRMQGAVCIGKGNIGKSFMADRGVSCYCYSQNDPNCRVEGLTATCIKR